MEELICSLAYGKLVSKMGKVTVYLHRSVQEFADWVACVLDTSRSEVIDLMIRHIHENELMDDIWENWDEVLKEWTELAEAEEEESESEGEEEGEEEEELEEEEESED